MQKYEKLNRDSETLSKIKDNIEMGYEYFRPNYDQYHWFRKFLYKTTLTDGDVALLVQLNKPQVEFNVLGAYVSRLSGEFSKQEPSIEVSSSDSKNVNPETIDFVEGHMRHKMEEAKKDSVAYDTYNEILSGGFSTFKVTTDYSSPTSFEQDIFLHKVYDPTLVGWDPLARLSHKGDGRFCFELFPKTKEEFKEEYPDIDVNNLKFTKNLEGFNWSYSTLKEDIMLVCDYYEKKDKRIKIVQIANGMVMPKKKYDALQAEYNDRVLAGEEMEQFPVIVDSRWTKIETICRYRLIENQILEYVETDFEKFPLVFCSGNSVFLKDGGSGGAVQEMTRPYIYDAIGAQKLKNFTGQTLANDIENMVQHKFMIMKEAIPNQADYINAYTDVQTPNVLVYNGFKMDDPNVSLAPPTVIQRPQIPPEISATFIMCDQLIQTILGSYDASLGINNNQLSGVAIVEGATQSNAAAMPYVVGYMQGLNRVCEIFKDQIPKHHKNPRTVSVIGRDGKKKSMKINQEGGVNIDYDSGSLKVNVDAGVNFAIQKNRALASTIQLMQVSPTFSQMINEVGMDQLLDNVEMRGVDQLKVKAERWMQQQEQMKQQQAQMQQQAMQNSPQFINAQAQKMKAMAEMQKVQHDIQHASIEDQQIATKNAIESQKQENDNLEVLSRMLNSHKEQAVKEERIQAEKMRSAVDVLLDATKHEHAKEMDHRTHEREDYKVRKNDKF